MNSSASGPPPVSSTPNSDKLSGQLIIKAQLGDDIRKIMIHNEDLTLNELVLMMERIFAGKISNSDEITIKYLDDDGDKITLLNDSDLTVALHFHKVLRLSVLVNGNEQLTNNSTETLNKEGSLIDAKAFRTELQQIRNSVQNILDRLQLPASQDSKINQEKEVTSTNTSSTAPPPAIVSGAAREFDPYKHLQQNQRSSTPDSIRSKSSLPRKTVSNEQKSFPTTPTIDNQFQHQSVESNDVNKAPPNIFQQTQMPTPQFTPAGFSEQQAKTAASVFGPPPTSFPNMPPLSNAGPPRFPTTFAPPTLQNSNTTLPTSNAPPTSAFIGQQQQQQQQSSLGPPPQQVGFYAQQQAFMQQKPGNIGFNPNTNNTFGQPPSSTTSSSPATINPSFVQPTGMPAPPPLASQQPYGNYAPQNNFYNPVQQYPKTS